LNHLGDAFDRTFGLSRRKFGERDRELGDVGIAVLSIFFETTQDDGLEPRR
jgi:hypothetical protein